MLPTSHLRPIDPPPAGIVLGSVDVSGAPAASANFLADAFSEFIATSSRLEHSYRTLQTEVVSLSHELVERNALLETSLDENRRMRQALEQMIQAMPCGVLVIDAAGRVNFVNGECRTLLALPDTLNAAVLTARIAELIPAAIYCHTTTSVAEFECEISLMIDGRERWMQVRRRVLKAADSCLIAQFILLLRDISAIKLAEQSRDAGRQALAQAEISTVLAHEIRNPLASLELFAELIEQDETGRNSWISNLRAGIRSLSGTVNNVLAFYGRAGWREVPVSLPQLLQEAADFMRPQAEQSRVNIHVAVKADEASTQGNVDALRQVLLNLLTNAIRHTPEGGSVTLSLRTVAGEPSVANPFAHRVAVLECVDTGTGIAAEHFGQIFDPGFSGRCSSGLGLAVCRQVAERHNGSIRATNIPNAGACFTLELPLIPMKEAA
ncbi:PAS/PAC sensor signal transduction histidine kinase [Bryocella elongata]|uniref:histidine kinase n=1 Tax=Bryocella elongata TaxID=863522 RepID=A0A1H5THY1_9BACT|nr:ATP-binding protein [Bryocella elongata]SEF62373.1 PAS/PAC sensor signal transduction histidine kinase [Bryocella elongata]